MPDSPAHSPYELVLGDALEVLHPRLRAYFSAIPAGHRGYGEGTFDVVGTPRRWLWPVLWLLGSQRILFPVWQKNVPFTVTNIATTDAAGRVAVAATRTFRFPGGERSMVDAITATPTGLVDFLGSPERIEAHLTAIVVNGELHMSSTVVRARLGRLWLRVPAAFAPVVALTERFDDASDRQRVSVVLSSGLLGKLYEYSGTFRYSIVGDPPAAEEGSA